MNGPTLSDVLSGAVAPSPCFNPPGSFDSRSYGLDPKASKNGKIVVFGLPKTGNVWLVSLLADYTGLSPIDPYVDVERQGVGMCHLPFSSEIACRTDFLHGMYLTRDLRDVIVSYFHNTQRADWRKGFPHFHCNTLEQFYFEWFLPRVSTFHDLERHAEAYVKLGLPVVRYEELFDDPQTEFARLLQRLGLPLDEDRVAQTVANNDLARLKNSGKQLDQHVPPAHFRRGGYGAYKQEMPGRVLEHVNQRFRSLLEDGGYEV